MKNKLETFFERELFKLKDILILKSDDQLFLFNRYVIKQINNQFKVELLDLYLTETFTFAQSAITWCIYHFNKKHSVLKRIKQLDSSITALEVNIKIHNTMLKEGFNVQIIETKLQEEKRKRNLLQKEFEGLINTSKKWQIMKFTEKMT